MTRPFHRVAAEAEAQKERFNRLLDGGPYLKSRHPSGHTLLSVDRQAEARAERGRLILAPDHQRFIGTPVRPGCFQIFDFDPAHLTWPHRLETPGSEKRAILLELRVIKRRVLTVGQERQEWAGGFVQRMPSGDDSTKSPPVSGVAMPPEASSL